MKINIRIANLVLQGFDYHDHKRINFALEQELTTLIRENGLPSGLSEGAEISQIDAPSFNIPADSNPKIIGSEVARSMYRAWQTHYSKSKVTHHKLTKLNGLGYTSSSITHDRNVT